MLRRPLGDEGPGGPAHPPLTVLLLEAQIRAHVADEEAVGADGDELEPPAGIHRGLCEEPAVLERHLDGEPPRERHPVPQPELGSACCYVADGAPTANEGCQDIEEILRRAVAQAAIMRGEASSLSPRCLVLVPILRMGCAVSRGWAAGRGAALVRARLSSLHEYRRPQGRASVVGRARTDPWFDILNRSQTIRTSRALHNPA